MTYAPMGGISFQRRFGKQLYDLGLATREALGENLVALILGGGYGRGEGAVTRVGGLERPYNDLDLFLVLRRESPLDALRPVRGKFERELGIEIDFSRPLTTTTLQILPHQLMWHDLLRGHKVLWGPEQILHELVPDSLLMPPPPEEATRLLLNRGVALLRARRIVQGQEKAPDPDFVRRNYYKALLAMGDAVFIKAGRTLPPLQRRLAELQELICDPELSRLYNKALRFKLCPDSFQVTATDLEECVRLWARHFQESLTPSLQEPNLSQPRYWFKNILRNARVRRFSWEHPREYLYRQLPRAADSEREWSKVYSVWSRYH